MDRRQELNEIIRDIYACATMPERWTVTTQRIQTYFSAAHCNIFSYRIDDLEFTSLIGGSGMDEHWVESYSNYFCYIDPFNKVFKEMGRGPGELFLSSRDFSQDEMSRDEYMHDFWHAQGLYEAAGYILMNPSEYMSQIGISRGRHGPAFEEEELLEFQLLFPHLVQAVEITNRFHDYARLGDLYRQTLDLFPFGVAVLGGDRRIHSLNTGLNSIISDSRQGDFVVDGSRLRLRDRRADLQLQTLITNCLSAPDGDTHGQLAGKVAVGLEVVILVMPLRTHLRGLLGDGLNDGVILVCLDSSWRKVSAPLLKLLFGLSEREAQMCELLSLGHTVKDAANQLSIAFETARSHLKAVFEKTGTHRQSELISLFNRLPNLE